MAGKTHLDCKMLDVGVGARPKGDVNVFDLHGEEHDQRESVTRLKAENPVLADIAHLPFKDESFNLAFSDHAIVHAQNPFSMLREMCRVAKRKVIIRCPHRKGSAANMANHLSFFDEEWFKKAADVLGFRGTQFITAYDYPIKLKIASPNRQRMSLRWRALNRLERSRLMEKALSPYEIEAWITKTHRAADTANVRFVVVYNIPTAFKNSFSSSIYVAPKNVTAYHNASNEPLPKFYNTTVRQYLHENAWFAFCHQDFILNEDIAERLEGKDVETIYGPIGGRPAAKSLSGMITQRDETTIGSQLKEDTPVQTLDEMCLIAHSEVFRQGLAFDEKFRFHFYGADFCMQAYTQGFDVLAMPLKCKHQSRTIHGDVNSPEYLSSLALLREKWKRFLPIRTTTKLVLEE